MIRLALALLLAVTPPAVAAPRHKARAVCAEVRDPGVGTYRICPPAPRRR